MAVLIFLFHMPKLYVLTEMKSSVFDGGFTASKVGASLCGQAQTGGRVDKSRCGVKAVKIVRKLRQTHLRPASQTAAFLICPYIKVQTA